MELRHLRYFLVLAETLNFTRAAERLQHGPAAPQPADPAKLEEELGVSLLGARPPLRLTRRALFQEHGSRLLAQLDEVRDGTRRVAEGRKRLLGIGFAPSTLYGALPELIRRLRTDAGLELGLSELITLQQVKGLKSGRIDIGFGRIRIEDAAVVQEVLHEDPLVAVCRPGIRCWARR